VSGIHLDALNRVVEHEPHDMTVTVEAGLTLARLQADLSRSRQWLPLDPPHPERLTVGALLAANASGPRRFGYGTCRDYLLGIKVVLADGRVIHSGGKVVKNVAGYDLAKLFVGSQGSLGVIAQATFKLRPLPEAEEFVQARRPSLDEATALLALAIESELTPVVVDLHDLTPSPDQHRATFSLVVGFAGTREEVQWQRTRANELGLAEGATLDHEYRFWNGGPAARRVSVLPSRLVETLRHLGAVSFLARAGNGVIYYRGGPETAKDEAPARLIQRLKNEFDPRHILPVLP